VNACKPHRFLERFPQSTRLRRSTYERVAARWSELELPGRPPRLGVFHPEERP
jgi:4-hydroxy-3-polyprenylbenzoate decarboxylase